MFVNLLPTWCKNKERKPQIILNLVVVVLYYGFVACVCKRIVEISQIEYYSCSPLLFRYGRDEGLNPGYH